MFSGDWKDSLFHYDRLVAIECRSAADYDGLIGRLLKNQELRAIPREEDEPVLVVPADALPLLPLQGIAHSVTALRNSLSLDRKVSAELEKRARSKPPKPSFYSIAQRTDLVLWRPFVPESVVLEIKQSLSRPLAS